ncbi:MAG: hypothetical protein ACM3WU_04265 [Bacillota bacterium]
MDIQGLLDFLEPAIMRERLIRISLFIAVYESLKETVIENVKYFYWSGFQDGKEIFKGYEEQVLSRSRSRKGSVLKGTLLWLVDAGAISDEDVSRFGEMTDMRNRLAHDMLTVLWEGLPEGLDELYRYMLELYRRIVRWWFLEVEVPTNPDITAEQYESISWRSVTTPALLVLDLIAAMVLPEQDSRT